MGFYKKLHDSFIGRSQQDFLTHRVDHTRSPVKDERIDSQATSADLANAICIGGIRCPGCFTGTILRHGGGVELSLSAGQKFKMSEKISAGGSVEVSFGFTAEKAIFLGSFYHGRDLRTLIKKFETAGQSLMGYKSYHRYGLCIFNAQCWSYKYTLKGEASADLKVGLGGPKKKTGSPTTSGSTSLTAFRDSNGYEYELFRFDLKALEAKVGGSITYQGMRYLDRSPFLIGESAYLERQPSVTAFVGKVFNRYLTMSLSNIESVKKPDWVFESGDSDHVVLLIDVAVTDKTFSASAKLGSAKLTMGSCGITDYSKGSIGAEGGQVQVSVAKGGYEKQWKKVANSYHLPGYFQKRSSASEVLFYRSYRVQQMYSTTKWSYNILSLNLKALRLGIEPGLLLSGKKEDAGTQQFGKGVLTPAVPFSYTKLQELDVLGIKEKFDNINKYLNKLSFDASLFKNDCFNNTMSYRFAWLQYKLDDPLSKKIKKNEIADVGTGHGLSVSVDTLQHILRCIVGLKIAKGNNETAVTEILTETDHDSFIDGKILADARDKVAENLLRSRNPANFAPINENYFKKKTYLSKTSRRPSKLKAIDSAISALESALNEREPDEFDPFYHEKLGDILERIFLTATDVMIALNTFAEGLNQKYAVGVPDGANDRFNRIINGLENKASPRWGRKDNHLESRERRASLKKLNRNVASLLKLLVSTETRLLIGIGHLARCKKTLLNQAERLADRTENIKSLHQKIVKEYVRASDLLNDVIEDKGHNPSGVILEVGYVLPKPKANTNLEKIYKVKEIKINGNESQLNLKEPDLDNLEQIQDKRLRYICFRHRTIDSYSFSGTLFRLGLDFGVFGTSLKVVISKNFRSEGCIDLFKTVFDQNGNEIHVETGVGMMGSREKRAIREEQSVIMCPMMGFGE